ncbi:MAG: hypothetical protein V1802_01335 [Candidatus Aenigmatarchaeota archaeon]
MKVPKINLRILNRHGETELTDFSDIYPILLLNSINGQQVQPKNSKSEKTSYSMSRKEKISNPAYSDPIMTSYNMHDVPYGAESITMAMSLMTGSKCIPLSREEKLLMQHGKDSSIVTVTQQFGKETAEVKISKNSP